MVKTFSSARKITEQDEEQKHRKKQAKKEAKLMLQVEQAKKDVRRAEQKVTKVQSELQAHKTRLSELEETLSQLQRAGQATGEANIHATDTAQTGHDLNTGAAAQTATSETTKDSTAGGIEVQPASPPPVEGRNDIALEDAAGASTSAETGNTPSKNIPSEPAHETPGAQVHADITVDPAPTEEDLTITSGAGSMPIITHDEHAWPPPQTREELAESIAEEVKHDRDHTTTISANEQNTAETNANEHEAGAEKDLTITSGQGTMPIITHDEHAWPPPQIREELAQSVVEETKHEHADTANGHGEASTDEEDEHHETEHEGSPNRSRRAPRRRARNNDPQ